MVPQHTSDSSSSQGLSTGAKAGLGVAIPFAIAITAGVASIAYYLRRQARSKVHTDQVEMMPPTGFPEPELVYKGPSPNPLANPHKVHKAIQYKMPAGSMSPRELH